MVEQDNSDSLVIAATNHATILDRALFRRFDDMVIYQMPDKAQIVTALKAKLGNFKTQKVQWAKVASMAHGLSYADITRSCEEAIKDALIYERTYVTHAELVHAIQDRRLAVSHKDNP
jgi:ATP-dependent 26S proteasome regulatory subunit